jgi:hypothetical protein
MKKCALAAFAAIAMLQCSARADLDPPNLHINGPGGFAQSGGGTDWVTLPSFGDVFTIQDVSNKSEVIATWHIVFAIPDTTGSILDEITKIAGTSVSIFNDGETNLGSGQNAYDVLNVPGSGLPNSMSFTNFQAADVTLGVSPAPTTFGLYDFKVDSSLNLPLLPQVINEVDMVGTLPTGTVIFAWGVDTAGVTYTTTFTNAGVISQQAVATPEPSTLAIAGLGIASAAFYLRRRTK